MRLSAVYFDDTVCIPGGKDVGGGASRQDLRESTFSAADGWSIERESPGVYSLHREGMKARVYVEGYGSTYVPATVHDYLRGVASGVGETISEEALGNVEVSAASLRTVVEAAKYLQTPLTPEGVRFDNLADRFEENGETPVAAMRKAADVIEAETVAQAKPKRRRK
jgi:hypothetical protein